METQDFWSDLNTALCNKMLNVTSDEHLTRNAACDASEVTALPPREETLFNSSC